MELFDNHKTLFGTATIMFIGLTVLVAIMPAIRNQDMNQPLPAAEPLSAEAKKRKGIICCEWMCSLSYSAGQKCRYG